MTYTGRSLDDDVDEDEADDDIRMKGGDSNEMQSLYPTIGS